jgi:hypothetical protein
MTPEEFKALIDVHGSDLTKWPHDKRVSATALMGRDKYARDLFADAQAFDALLRAPEPELSEGRRHALTEGVMARIAQSERSGGANDTCLNPSTPLSVSKGGFSTGFGLGLVFPRPGWVLTYATMGLVIGVGLGLSVLPASGHVARGLVDGMAFWMG